MKKCLLVALTLLAPLIPGPAESFSKLENLKTVSGLPGVSDVGAPPAVKGAPVSPPTFTAQGIPDRVQPDWSYTPGKLCTPDDPGFQEYRYAEHIPYCKRNVTQAMKVQAAAHYGVPQSDWGNYEFDHLIPLSIGGNSHIDNVWPQPHGDPDGSNDKDKLEDSLYLQMKAGTITQAEAIRQIYAWFGKQPQLRKFLPPGVAATAASAK